MAISTHGFGSDRSSTHEVVVVGAGYVGVIAANRLLSSLVKGERDRLRVTVVNPRPDFVQRIRLHEVAAGTIETASFPLTDVLHQRTALMTGRAAQIDPDARIVDVERGGVIQPLPYDMLVYAIGS